MSTKHPVTKHPIPEKYKAPLKKRSDITAYLMDRQGHSDHYDFYLFAFNVKTSPDLRLRHLVEVYRESGEVVRAQFAADLRRPAYRKELRRLYKENEDNLFDWGLEDARNGVTDGDTYKMLWDGTELDADWAFAGRSGGWLVLTETCFGRFPRHQGTKGEYEEWMEGLDYPDLKTFYRFIVQCEADFTPEIATKEVEHHAAWGFFNRVVEDDMNPLLAVWAPEWMSETAKTLAKTIRENVEWGTCPILADAIEDAGCDFAPLLVAMRGPDPRGQKVVRHAVRLLTTLPRPKLPKRIEMTAGTGTFLFHIRDRNQLQSSEPIEAMLATRMLGRTSRYVIQVRYLPHFAQRDGPTALPHPAEGPNIRFYNQISADERVMVAAFDNVALDRAFPVGCTLTGDIDEECFAVTGKPTPSNQATDHGGVTD